MSCRSIPSFAHADNHSRRTRTRTSAAERGCLSPRASAIWRPSRWGQSAVHLAACAVALWPCAAHWPPLTAHPCPDPLDHHRTITPQRKSVSSFFAIFAQWNILRKFVGMKKVCSVGKCVQRRSWAPTRFEKQTVLSIHTYIQLRCVSLYSRGKRRS